MSLHHQPDDPSYDSEDDFIERMRRANHRGGDGNTNKGGLPTWGGILLTALTTLNTGIALLLLQAVYSNNGDMREIRGELTATREEVKTSRDDERSEMHDMRSQFANLIERIVANGNRERK